MITLSGVAYVDMWKNDFFTIDQIELEFGYIDAREALRITEDSADFHLIKEAMAAELPSAFKAFRMFENFPVFDMPRTRIYEFGEPAETAAERLGLLQSQFAKPKPSLFSKILRILRNRWM